MVQAVKKCILEIRKLWGSAGGAKKEKEVIDVMQ